MDMGRHMHPVVLADLDAAPYLAAGKPVWNVEYPAGWQAEGRDFDLDQACGGGVSTLIKRLSLNADTIVCD